MSKKTKYPYFEVHAVPCPHPECSEVLEIPGCFKGEGICSCHALRIWVKWLDHWTPVVTIDDLPPVA